MPDARPKPPAMPCPRPVELVGLDACEAIPRPIGVFHARILPGPWVVIEARPSGRDADGDPHPVERWALSLGDAAELLRDLGQVLADHRPEPSLAHRGTHP